MFLGAPIFLSEGMILLNYVGDLLLAYWSRSLDYPASPVRCTSLHGYKLLVCLDLSIHVPLLSDKDFLPNAVDLLCRELSMML